MFEVAEAYEAMMGRWRRWPDHTEGESVGG